MSQRPRADMIAAKAREDAFLAMTIDAIAMGAGPVSRDHAIRKLGCNRRQVEWAVRKLVDRGLLKVEGSASNYRHHVTDVGVTDWSFGKPPAPMRKDKEARKAGSPEEKPAVTFPTIRPLRGSDWKPTGCRWPYGDPVRYGGTGYTFCEEPVRTPGASYCVHHHAIAYGSGSRAKVKREVAPDYRIRKPAEREAVA